MLFRSHIDRRAASKAVDMPLRDLITYTPEHLTPDQRTRRLQEINTLAFAGIGGPGNRALAPAAKIEAETAEICHPGLKPQ